MKLPLDPDEIKGFLEPEEGARLFELAAASVAPCLEVGSYCGKSTLYLGSGCRAANGVLFAVDHHRGSEENQPGWEHHDPDLVDPVLGVIDTLPFFRRTIREAGLEGSVVALVGDSPAIGRYWTARLALLFIDGGHGEEPAHRDYEVWTPFVAPDGVLAIHDVLPNPADGGRPPYEIYLRALRSGNFEEVRAVGSLRVLRRLDNGREHRPESRFG